MTSVWPVISGVLSLSIALGQVPRSKPPTMDEVNTRLKEYERQVDQGKDNPASLAAVARMVVARAMNSRRFEIWSDVCLSGFAPEGGDCQARLQSVLRNRTAPLPERSAAGAALARRGDKAAVREFLDLVKGLPADQLADIAPDLRALPDAEATPLLLRVLHSPDAADQATACRVLGAIDTPEVRNELRAAVDRATPGQSTWNTCMVARARLGEPDSTIAISGYSRGMQGEDLLDASMAMLEIGNEQGDFLLRKLTREAPGVVRLKAAGQLVATDPGYAAKFAGIGLGDPDPKVRAEALVLERRLHRAPARSVRSKLIDPDGLVQTRAAEAILDWLTRRNGR